MFQTNLKKQIYKIREELFNRIAGRFKIPVEVKLVPGEEILNNAEGCFEGDVIKIKKSLPLFWQLLVLEHEIGHFWAIKQNTVAIRKTFRILRQKEDREDYEEEEIRAWEWVEDHPVKKGSIIDQEIQKYLKELEEVFKNNQDYSSILTWAFWF